MAPGEVLAVNLAATPEPFTGWIPHAEVGGGESGGEHAGEGESGGEHGSGGEGGSAIRPNGIDPREDIESRGLSCPGGSSGACTVIASRTAS